MELTLSVPISCLKWPRVYEQKEYWILRSLIRSYTRTTVMPWTGAYLRSWLRWAFPRCSRTRERRYLKLLDWLRKLSTCVSREPHPDWEVSHLKSSPRRRMIAISCPTLKGPRICWC
uniref:Uncharacterized protein n=1 Tax=Cacopsylla melanoneura TaxID=428564 RepID=A0A8D9AA55_9HEMI